MGYRKKSSLNFLILRNGKTDSDKKLTEAKAREEFSFFHNFYANNRETTGQKKSFKKKKNQKFSSFVIHE